MTTTIAIVIPESLSSLTDSHLAALWHVAQANPAPLDDKDAGKIAERIGREIIRRWLRDTPPELYHHQGHHHYWWNLVETAGMTWNGEASAWVPGEKLAPDEADRQAGICSVCYGPGTVAS